MLKVKKLLLSDAFIYFFKEEFFGFYFMSSRSCNLAISCKILGLEYEGSAASRIGLSKLSLISNLTCSVKD